MKITAQRILLFLVGLLGAWIVVGYYGGFYPRSADQHTPQVVRSDDAAVGTNGVDGSDDEAVAEASSNLGVDAATDASPDEAVLADDIVEEVADTDTSERATGDASNAVASDDKKVVVPSFDLLRVAPDGSMVIAGRADPNSTVEIVAGSSVLATAKASGNGDFASVVALEPGEHTVVLRSIASETASATSLETAIVSVPSTPDGEVVALVQEPGEPSRLITVPEPKPEQEIAQVANDPENESEAVAEASDESEQAAFVPPPLAEGEYRKDEPVEPQSSPQTSPEPDVTVQEQQEQPQERRRTSPFIAAVEIDGREIFVAGEAEAEKRVRVYANDVLLGQDKADRNGRFLIQTERDLPVGDYIIRADVLDTDEQTVTARAAVPFAREPGESLTSVADNSAPSSMSGEAETEDGAIPMAAPLRQDRAVIIRKGDTLWHISRRIYGLGTRYTTIYQANKEQIRDPDLIWPGQTFVLPETSNEGEPADLSSVHTSE